MLNGNNIAANGHTPTESALRRKAARRGYRLTKIREKSRWFNTYGPFMISDAARNAVLHCGITAEEVNEWLTVCLNSPNLPTL